MRKIFSFILLTSLVACSKKSANESHEAETVVQGGGGVQSYSLPDDGDDKKKYAPIICYIPGEPNKVGTECSVPGNKCKSYECTLSTARLVGKKLSDSDIDKYAINDARVLLAKGLIEKKDLAYFVEISRKALVEQNKKIK